MLRMRIQMIQMMEISCFECDRRYLWRYFLNFNSIIFTVL